MGSVGLHLIKGLPCSPPPDNLIVGHIALAVEDMDGLRDRLRDLGVETRRNVSVPNPARGGRPADQVKAMSKIVKKHGLQ